MKCGISKEVKLSIIINFLKLNFKSTNRCYFNQLTWLIKSSLPFRKPATSSSCQVQFLSRLHTRMNQCPQTCDTEQANKREMRNEAGIAIT